MPVKILQPYEGTIPCRVVSPRRKASRFEFTGRLKSPCPPCACVSSFHVPWLSAAAQRRVLGEVVILNWLFV